MTAGQLAEVTAGLRPAAAMKTVTFAGGATTGALSTKAAYTTTLTGTNNDMVFTADTAGTAGNSISIAYLDPGQVGHAIEVSVTGTAIKVILATSSGVKASTTLTSDNTDVSDGDTVTIGSRTYRFKNTIALVNDVHRTGTADTTLGNLVKAINGTGTAGTDYFTGTAVNTDVSAANVSSHATVLTKLTAGAAGNSVATTTTAAHLSFTGATLAGGITAGAITSTAAQVKTAIEADTGAAALVDLANSGADDGTGIVTALTTSLLTGGSDGKVPLFTVTGSVLVALRGYVKTSLTGANATLVHGITGTTNALITILTSTNIAAGKGIDSTGLVTRGTALAKTPIYLLNDESIFATTATAATTGGVINYICDYIPLTEGATVTPA